VDIDRYLAENEPSWALLTRLNEAARRRASALSDGEVEQLIGLHLRTSADLSHARLHQPEPALLDRLSAIVAGSRTVLEGRRVVSIRTVGRFFTERFPVAVWQLRRFVAVSACLTFLPALAIGAWISRSPAALEASAPAALRDAYVQQDFEQYYSDRPASQFATEVTVNNIRVSILAFAGGILLGLGTVAILISNGANLGFAAGLFAAAGEQSRFYGLIVPHGLLELTAVVIAGAAGLSLGWAIISPGDMSRGEAVTAAAQRCLTVILGLAMAFVVAGLIEGFVTGSTLSTALRVGLGIAVEVGFLSYLYVFGRRGGAVVVEGDDRTDVTAFPDASGELTW
jgi:uncharacterized membrane protein SpoIIM required for sporulation